MSVLEEPLIQIADDVPPKDDPGWQLFETDDKQDRQHIFSQSDGYKWNSRGDDGQSGSDSGSGKTLAVVVQAPSVVEDTHSKSTVMLPSVEAEAKDEAMLSVCTSTRQRAMDFENKAIEAQQAGEEASKKGDIVSSRRWDYNAATYQVKAAEFHRKAACVIYAANNLQLPPGIIDLRGLRPCEVQVVEAVLQNKMPDHPSYRFLFDISDDEQRQTLGSICKTLGLAYYRDGPDIRVFVRTPADDINDQLVSKLLRQSTDRKMGF